MTIKMLFNYTLSSKKTHCTLLLWNAMRDTLSAVSQNIVTIFYSGVAMELLGGQPQSEPVIK